MEYKIRNAEISDSKRILEIRSHPSFRPYFNNPKEIAFPEHHQWFIDKYFKEKGNYCFILLADGEVIGYCRYDLSEGSFIVSIAIDADFHGKGAGTWLLGETIKKIKNSIGILAEIKKGNIASVKVFQKNGFKIYKEDENNFYLKYEPEQQ